MSTNLSFRSRGGHLAHLEGVPQDQDMELNQLMALLHSESFFTPNHHVGRGIASYLHSRLTLAPLWDDSRNIEPRIFICSCVYWCCWNVSTARLLRLQSKTQLEVKDYLINKTPSKTEASNRFSSAGFSNGAVSGNISRQSWSNDSLYQ